MRVVLGSVLAIGLLVAVWGASRAVERHSLRSTSEQAEPASVESLRPSAKGERSAGRVLEVSLRVRSAGVEAMPDGFGWACYSEALMRLEGGTVSGPHADLRLTGALLVVLVQGHEPVVVRLDDKLEREALDLQVHPVSQFSVLEFHQLSDAVFPISIEISQDWWQVDGKGVSGGVNHVRKMMVDRSRESVRIPVPKDGSTKCYLLAADGAALVPGGFGVRAGVNVVIAQAPMRRFYFDVGGQAFGDLFPLSPNLYMNRSCLEGLGSEEAGALLWWDFTYASRLGREIDAHQSVVVPVSTCWHVYFRSPKGCAYAYLSSASPDVVELQVGLARMTVRPVIDGVTLTTGFRVVPGEVDARTFKAVFGRRSASNGLWVDVPAGSGGIDASIAIADRYTIETIEDGSLSVARMDGAGLVGWRCIGEIEIAVPKIDGMEWRIAVQPSVGSSGGAQSGSAVPAVQRSVGPGGGIVKGLPLGTYSGQLIVRSIESGNVAGTVSIRATLTPQAPRAMIEVSENDVEWGVQSLLPR